MNRAFFRSVREGRTSVASFTLIELLAVIVIASLAVTVVSVSMASADRGAQVIKFAAAIREFDFRGRLHARTSGGMVILGIDPEKNMLLLITLLGELVAQERIDRDLKVMLATESDGDTNEVLFDRQGRTNDYECTIQSGNSIQRWNVAGLTGAFNREDAP